LILRDRKVGIYCGEALRAGFEGTRRRFQEASELGWIHVVPGKHEVPGMLGQRWYKHHMPNMNLYRIGQFKAFLHSTLWPAQFKLLRNPESVAMYSLKELQRHNTKSNQSRSQPRNEIASRSKLRDSPVRAIAALQELKWDYGEVSDAKANLESGARENMTRSCFAKFHFFFHSRARKPHRSELPLQHINYNTMSNAEQTAAWEKVQRKTFVRTGL
jgi:hypothetical protein